MIPYSCFIVTYWGDWVDPPHPLSKHVDSSDLEVSLLIDRSGFRSWQLIFAEDKPSVVWAFCCCFVRLLLHWPSRLFKNFWIVMRYSEHTAAHGLRRQVCQNVIARYINRECYRNTCIPYRQSNSRIPEMERRQLLSKIVGKAEVPGLQLHIVSWLS